MLLCHTEILLKQKNKHLFICSSSLQKKERIIQYGIIKQGEV